jgi:UDP-N-acetylmuramoyl-L-alanyl-D-glutamate--2,6-diaminopimelate ligase
MGAVAVLATPEGAETGRRDLGGKLPVPVFLSETPRAELARLAAAFHGRQPEVMAAVTGTNGKTSTVHFLGQIWRAAGRAAASFGTTGVAGAEGVAPPGMTTPEPISLHAFLARLADRGITHAAMEASSHGLAQHRLDGVRLAAAGFANISRDHLDYHASFEAYLSAKMRLFDSVLPPDGVAVTNIDDPASAHVRAIAARRGQRLLSVGRAGEADLRLATLAYRAEDQRLALTWAGETREVTLPLVGAFQADNAALAAALAIATGVAPDAAVAALGHLAGVPGRMELAARRANGAPVYVDYAHTPDALAHALDALRPHVAGRLVCVFGAGGDRDPGKRAEMGAAVAARADHAIVTDDNPRTEDPAAIRRAVRDGAPEAEEVAGRAEAILAAVDALRDPGDGLVIAGKGHERGQEIAGAVHPFDDAEIARAAVAALDGAGAGEAP